MSELRKYLRFRRPHRVEHWVFMASFTTLAVTGLAQKYAEAPISQWIVVTLGGIESVRVIHRLAAITIMVVAVYHIGAVGYRLYVNRSRLHMLPGLFDVRNAWQSLKYNLGLSKARVQQGRYGFEEKLEYWAVVWGTLIMVLTGFMLWNPIATTSILPGEVVPAAKIAHGLEAVLAVVAIFLWHLYHVLIRTFNRSMFTGYVNEEQMLDEHPLELADIKAGIAERPVDPQKKERRRVFFGVYGVVGTVLLVGIFVFVTFEKTAIETVPAPPPEQVTVFAPLTPTPLPTRLPTATPAPVTAVTWAGGLGDLFKAKCTACHGSPSGLGGLDLSTYEGALKGGNSGLGIVPGDPEASGIVRIQSQGGHPGQLTDSELETVMQWIEAGAPEQ
ncbi:MAG TPA: cytochrome b/b6 domain-containing protein [Anaerolineae bacterium]|nr:cytochrome b/b6 domain-containing protein [Anaerolineae bacterium]